MLPNSNWLRSPSPALFLLALPIAADNDFAQHLIDYLAVHPGSRAPLRFPVSSACDKSVLDGHNVLLFSVATCQHGLFSVPESVVPDIPSRAEQYVHAAAAASASASASHCLRGQAMAWLVSGNEQSAPGSVLSPHSQCYLSLFLFLFLLLLWLCVNYRILSRPAISPVGF